jgi:ERCC4-related helicase
MQAAPRRGSFVWIRQRRWRVEFVSCDNHVIRLDVISQSSRKTFLAPFDCVSTDAARRRLSRVRPQQLVARLAALIGNTPSCRDLQTAAEARIDILAHQLEPALAVLAGARRLLIADDVGLGKTIQAGLIIAELARRDRASRALILAPASLRSQWTEELGSRLALEPREAHADSIDDFARSNVRSAAFWDLPGLWIASLDYIKQPHVLENVVTRVWDLVVIDEAHTACGDSRRHGAAAALALRARTLVLLTATPHSGDDVRFRRLTQLGALVEATDEPDELTIFRRTRGDVGMSTSRRVRWRWITRSPDECSLLDAIVAFERAVLNRQSEARDAAILLLSVFRKRALSTSAALFCSIKRRIAFLDAHRANDQPWIQQPLEFDTDQFSADEEYSLTADIRLAEGDERRWLATVMSLCAKSRAADSKLQYLTTLLGRTSESVVIFTEFRDSLTAIVEALRPVRTTAVLHGGLSPDEQRAELRRFTKGECSVLVATDVASQGLNLQSACRWIINVDLPWTPDRLEQRTGRVDRIGQQRIVHVSLFASRHAAESPLIVSMARRVLAARQALTADVFESIAPDEAALRAHIIAGSAIPERPGERPCIRPCHRWRRSARITARRLVRRRQLGRHFRGPNVFDRPLWSRLSKPMFARLCGPDDALFLFSVPIVNGSGVTLEERLVCVRVNGMATAAVDRHSLIDGAQRIAEQATSPRARRLGRLRRAAFDRAVHRERLLLTHVARGVQIYEVQPGLFDRRATRAAELARAAARQIADELANWTAQQERACSVSAASPRLLLAAGHFAR